jgi:hypothetical protein
MIYPEEVKTMFLIYGIVVLFVVFLGFVSFAFWIWMLVDCLKYERPDGADKLVWILVIVFLHWVGGLIYYYVRRQPRIEAKAISELFDQEESLP